ncbi:MAG: TRAP transporter small permease [Sideroxyarcus sp.]|nr:TRAP transporter small permease [Sideroxyarcus sp.]
MKYLKRLDEWLIALMLAAMTLLTFSQVVMRYVFNSGFTWALELTTVLFACMIFIGISYGVRVGAHIGVDALVKLFPPKPRRVVSVVAVLLCLVYAGMVIYGSMQYVLKMKSAGIELEDMAIPMWMVRAILPVGFVLLALRFLPVLMNLVTGKSDRLHLADEVEEALKLKTMEENK